MWVVRLEGVTKRHRAVVGSSDSMRGELAGLGRRLRGRARPAPQPRPAALQDVSFDIEQGSAVALVGANGAGKTTALRLMSRIIYPTEGRISVRGRVGALLEVSSGVHPELSGRENIWLYGSIIGIPRAEIRRCFDDIVAFSELESAIDKQAKFYSSGMQLRLGFAIATFLRPNILLVDESLATADLNFQLKCIDRMATLVREGTSLLFVSHELAAVETLCTRGILLERGRLVHDASAHETLVEYKRRLAAARAERVDTSGEAENLRIVDAACTTVDGRPASQLAVGEDVVVEVTVECLVDGLRPVVDLRVADLVLGDLVQCSSTEEVSAEPLARGLHRLSCRLCDLPLRPRQYAVTVGVRDVARSTPEPTAIETTQFRVEDDQTALDLASALSAGGPLLVRRRWTRWRS